MPRRFSSASPDSVGATGTAEAGGLGGLLSEAMGGQVEYRAGRGTITDADRARIDRDRGMQEASRAGEAQFTNYLRDAAMGRTGPSVAQQQLAQSTGQAQQAVAARAASARGPNRALAMRDAIRTQGQMQGEANAQGAVLRAQEQMSREQLVAEQLRQRRLADLQAQGLSQDEAIAKLQAEMQAQQINADIAKTNAGAAEKAGGGILSALGGLAASDIRNKRDITPLEPLPQSAAANDNGGGGAVDIGAMASMLSDRKAKVLEDENATLRAALKAASGAVTEDEMDRFQRFGDRARGPGVDLRQAPGYAYRYKNPDAPGAAPGEQNRPVSQVLERASARSALVDTPRGKMVDGGRLALTTAAATGQEQRRGDMQDARITGLENALRDALRATRGGSFGDDPMELGYDEKSGIYRAIGSVPGESNEGRLERELRETLDRRNNNPFNVRSPAIDTDALDAASRRAGIEPVTPRPASAQPTGPDYASLTTVDDDETKRRIVRGGDRVVGAAEIFNRSRPELDIAALDEAYRREGGEPVIPKRKRAGGGR